VTPACSAICSTDTFGEAPLGEQLEADPFELVLHEPTAMLLGLVAISLGGTKLFDRLDCHDLEHLGVSGRGWLRRRPPSVFRVRKCGVTSVFGTHLEEFRRAGNEPRPQRCVG
jgi:hypothetical protein